MLECQAMIEPQAKKRGINVSFPQFEAPFFLQADRTRVKQILINLLSNAIKYNHKDGTVVVSYLTNNSMQRLRISVEDSGEGLSPQQISQLFQPFNRLGQEQKEEEGTGIGLVMTKRLIELMGGEIGVVSTPDKGSVFWFELNLTVAPQFKDLPSAAPVLEVDSLHAEVKTLLYIEDNPANLMLVEDLIARRPDINLISARDGLTGIKLALEQLPDMILMDINLPGINGIRVLEILHADLRTAGIPVVALSANAMPRDIEKGMEAGFFRYLTKPIRVSEFMDTLDVALKFSEIKQASVLPV
jgi:CheY-like chemotaxis protein